MKLQEYGLQILYQCFGLGFVLCMGLGFVCSAIVCHRSMNLLCTDHSLLGVFGRRVCPNFGVVDFQTGSILLQRWLT